MINRNQTKQYSQGQQSIRLFALSWRFVDAHWVGCVSSDSVRRWWLHCSIHVVNCCQQQHFCSLWLYSVCRCCLMIFFSTRHHCINIKTHVRKNTPTRLNRWETHPLIRQRLGAVNQQRVGWTAEPSWRTNNRTHTSLQRTWHGLGYQCSWSGTVLFLIYPQECSADLRENNKMHGMCHWHCTYLLVFYSSVNDANYDRTC